MRTAALAHAARLRDAATADLDDLKKSSTNSSVAPEMVAEGSATLCAFRSRLDTVLEMVARISLEGFER